MLSSIADHCTSVSFMHSLDQKTERLSILWNVPIHPRPPALRADPRHVGRG